MVLSLAAAACSFDPSVETDGAELPDTQAPEDGLEGIAPGSR